MDTQTAHDQVQDHSYATPLILPQRAIPAQTPPPQTYPYVHPVIPNQMPPQHAGKKSVSLVVSGIGIVLVLAAVWAGYIFGYQQRNNSIVVRGQPVTDSILIDKLVMGYPRGGFVVVQRKSGFPNGELIGNSGYIPPGTYINVGIDVLKSLYIAGNTPIESGEYLYVVLYGNSDDIPSFSDGDVQLKDVFGVYTIARFQVQ